MILLEGKRIQYVVNEGLIMTRYFDAFFINENSSIKIILKDNKE